MTTTAGAFATATQATSTDDPTLAVLNDIRLERRKQPDANDDAYEHGQIARAAAVYAANITSRSHANRTTPDGGNVRERLWPWQFGEHKHYRGERRRLVVAAALLVAEIERLDRATP